MPIGFDQNCKVACLLTLLLANSGCRVHQRLDIISPPTEIPCAFHAIIPGEEEEVGCHWWRQFGSEELNTRVETALEKNLEMRGLWWKVLQACAEARIQNAGRLPSIDLTGQAGRFKGGGGVGISSVDGVDVEDGFSGGGGSAFNLYQISGVLSYEVDLWRRIDSLAKAACKEMCATREDVESFVLTLSGTVVDLWFTIQEQRELLSVIDTQIGVSRTLLELLELRFGLGISSALDVYQQRLQLASTEAEKPPVLSTLRTAEHHLEVLLGRPPQFAQAIAEPEEIHLPPEPFLGSPAALLCHRPDLRAIWTRIQAADDRVAAAIADLFPRFNFTLSYGFQAVVVQNLFQTDIYRIASDFLLPIFDAGRRRAQVLKQKAVLCELLENYGQAFLTALQEVEDAVVKEHYQRELLAQIEQQIVLAKANLTEARWRYINGLNDYLTVIAAIQSLQELQRRQVVEYRSLLQQRASLYRALGGPEYFVWEKGK